MKKLNSNTKNLSISIIFAALYAVGVVSLGYFSYGPVQVRVADALLPLAMIFGFPAASGLSFGCLVANVFGGLGPVDIIGGSIANLVACTLAWYIGRNRSVSWRFFGSVVQTLVVSLVVGSYLSYLLNIPLEVEIPLMLLGSTLAINALGFPIEEAIRKSKIFANINVDKNVEKPKSA